MTTSSTPEEADVGRGRRRIRGDDHVAYGLRVRNRDLEPDAPRILRRLRPGHGARSRERVRGLGGSAAADVGRGKGERGTQPRAVGRRPNGRHGYRPGELRRLILPGDGPGEVD